MESDKMESERAVRIVLIPMSRRPPFCHFGSCPWDDFHGPLHLIRPPFCHFGSCPWDDFHGPLHLMMATGILESIDSGVSLKSDWSAEEQIDFKNRVFLRPDFSSSEEHDVSDDEDWVKSSDNQMAVRRTLYEPAKSGFHIPLRQQSPFMMATGSLESNDSGVSLKSDRSKAGWIDFKDRVSPRLADFSSSEEEDVSDDEGFFEPPDDLREDDILPYMYPWSDDCDWMELADNLQGFFGSDVSAVDDWINSLDDLMAVRRTLSEPAKSDFHIPLRQQSLFMMAHSSVEAFGSGLTLMNDSFIRPRQHSLPRMVLKSMEACGSSLSLMNDSFIRTGQRSPPREEMNQELSSEVGGKHN